MTITRMILALGLVVAVPVSAGAHDRGPAPAGTPATLYCMHVEAITGSRLETVACWTRAEWAEQGVDVDHDWAREGVRTIG